MKLWLDDIRATPEGWTRAHSVDEAKSLILKAGERFEFASLDHDLGDYEPQGGDAWVLTRWMVELWHEGKNVFPRRGLRIHSSNTTGIANMLSDADSVDPYGDSQYRRNSPFVERGSKPADGWPIPGVY